jgi:hypothetical protein
MTHGVRLQAFLLIKLMFLNALNFRRCLGRTVSRCVTGSPILLDFDCGLQLKQRRVQMNSFFSLQQRTLTDYEIENLATGLQQFCDVWSTFKAKSIISSGVTRGKAFSWAKRQARLAALKEGLK